MWNPEGVDTERTVRVVTATCPAGLPAGSWKRPILIHYKCQLVSWEAEKVKGLKKSFSTPASRQRNSKGKIMEKNTLKWSELGCRGKESDTEQKEKKEKVLSHWSCLTKLRLFQQRWFKVLRIGNQVPAPQNNGNSQLLEGSRKPAVPPGAGCLAVPWGPMGGASWRPGTAGSDELSFWVIMPNYVLLQHPSGLKTTIFLFHWVMKE